MISLQSVCKAYLLGGERVRALSDVSLSIARNEYIALTGASGSGKSTLMNVLGCLDSPSSGEYLLDGTFVSGLDDEQLAVVRNRKIGFVFQSFNLMPRMSALDNVAQPLMYRGVPLLHRRAEAELALARVGLSGRERHKPNELSGGQRQRVAIARALVGKPELLLADEPTGNLDSRTAKEIMALFAALHASGQTLVIVTHDSGVAGCSRRVIRLHDGRVAEDCRV